MKSAILKIDGEPEVLYDSEEFEDIFDLLSIMWDQDNQEYEVEVSITVYDGMVYDIHMNDVSIGYFAVNNICKTYGVPLPERLLICDDAFSELEDYDFDTDIYVIPLVGDLPCV